MRRSSGATSGIAIDAFVSDPAVNDCFVRLTDVRAEHCSTGNIAGADIDAVGAITTVLLPAATTPPVIAALVAPEPNAAGWHTAPVTIGWTVSDPASAITSASGCEETVLTAETSGDTLP